MAVVAQKRFAALAPFALALLLLLAFGQHTMGARTLKVAMTGGAWFGAWCMTVCDQTAV